MKIKITKRLDEDDLINRGEQPDKVLIDRDALERLIFKYEEHLNEQSPIEEQSQAEIECQRLGLQSFRSWLNNTSAVVQATKGTWGKVPSK